MNTQIGRIAIIALLFFMFALMGCPQQPQMQDQTNGMAPIKAIAILHSTEGNDVHGVVTFMKTDVGVEVVADVEGLTPGKHGFHIHEYGDCSAPDATTAGGHFVPDGNPHGAPGSMERHGGDLGNLTAEADGKAHLEWLDTHLTFQGAHSILGRAVIVHAGEDDLATQPTGNAGGRLACGVIGVAQ